MDKTTYALCKKLAAGAVSGVASMSVSGQTLTINCTDGTVLTMTFPTPADGVSITDVEINASNHLICTLSDGSTEDAGEIHTVKGEKGDRGDKGDAGQGIAQGGSEGQMLVKNSDSDYDTKWVTPPGGTVVDDEMSLSSENPVQNKVVTAAIGDKVDKVSGKGLSTNDYSDADKAIVDGVGTALDGKVDKISGKGLSTNDYTDADKAEVAKVANKADAEDVIDGASYDSTNHQILFKNGTTTLFSLDAAAFVKDGMVDDVEISGGNLVITFNTDAGKQAISIPLTDIFDPANYYDKDDVDGLLADKADKVESATNGDFAGLDANGNLTDSGKKASDFGTADEIADIVNFYGSKNLIPYPYLNKSGTEFRGVTYTVNADESITANGTATGGDSAFFILQRNVDNDFLSRIGQGNFILSGCPAGGSLQTYYLNFNYGDAQSSVGNLGQDTGNGKEIIIDTDITQYNAQISVLIREGVTVSNLTFYPMLRMASIKDDTYVPYVPTNAKLNEEKMSYSDNGVLGAKNLIQNMGVAQTVSGVTFTLNADGSVTANGTATAAIPFNVSGNILDRLDPTQEYILSGCPKGGSASTYRIYVSYQPGNGNLGNDYGDGVRFSLSSTSVTYTTIVIYIFISNGAVLNNLVFRPMLRLASDPDGTYQPYAKTNFQLTNEGPTVKVIPLEWNEDLNLGSDKGGSIHQYGKLYFVTYWFKATTATTGNVGIVKLPKNGLIGGNYVITEGNDTAVWGGRATIDGVDFVSISCPMVVDKVYRAQCVWIDNS